MIIEQHTPGKKARRNRTLWTSLLLFATVWGIAAAISLTRRQNPPRKFYTPPGWSMSFKAPTGFPRPTETRSSFSHMFRFAAHTGSGTRVLIGVARLDPDFAPNPESGANKLLDLLHPPSALYTSRERRTNTPLGPLDAVEIWEPLVGSIRTARHPDGYLYTVFYNAFAPFDDDPFEAQRRLYPLFDDTCRSFTQRED